MPKQTFLQQNRFLVSITCLSLALSSCSTAASPEAKEAVAAFQKIDSRVELGINITDYLSQVSDAKLALEKYKSLPGNNKKITQSLESALSTHVSALDFWNCKIQNNEAGALAQCQTPKLDALATQFPKIKIYVQGLDPVSNDERGKLFFGVDTNKVLSTLWSEAKTETTQAQAALN